MRLWRVGLLLTFVYIFSTARASNDWPWNKKKKKQKATEKISSERFGANCYLSSKSSIDISPIALRKENIFSQRSIKLTSMGSSAVHLASTFSVWMAFASVQYVLFCWPYFDFVFFLFFLKFNFFSTQIQVNGYRTQWTHDELWIVRFHTKKLNKNTINFSPPITYENNFRVRNEYFLVSSHYGRWKENYFTAKYTQ